MEIEETNPLKVEVKIPFPSSLHATVAYDVLRIDAEPKRSSVSKTIELKDNFLIVNFSGTLAKNVRVGLTSFFDNLILCCETMEAFGAPTEPYKHY